MTKLLQKQSGAVFCPTVYIKFRQKLRENDQPSDVFTELIFLVQTTSLRTVTLLFLEHFVLGAAVVADEEDDEQNEKQQSTDTEDDDDDEPQRLGQHALLHFTGCTYTHIRTNLIMKSYKTTFANLLLYREVYFVFFDFFSFTVFDLQCFILLYNICVCHLFNKEIS